MSARRPIPGPGADGEPGPPVAPRPAAVAAGLLLAVAAAALAAPRTAAAQEPPSLDRIAAAADSGRADSARAMLARWLSARSADGPAQQRERARYLQARLTADADSAARRYLRAAVEGSSAHGDLAWLRLAQLRLAAGEPDRALEALDRLRSDYPSTDLAAEAWLWTGHARRAAGRGEAACAAWRRAVVSAGSGEERVRRRARSGLGGCAGAAEAAPEDAERAAGEGREPAGGEGAPADTVRAGWAVQVGAFRDRDGAERLIRTVGKEVPDVELVIVPPGPGDDLHRVQTRPPTDRAAARSLADELTSREIPAIVVRTGP